MFGGFIIFCGFTHFIEVWTFYDPLYRLSGFIKLLTAIISVATAISLIPLTPKMLNIPTMFYSILDLAPDGIIIVNKQGKITLANIQASKMFGHGSLKLLGKSIEIIIPDLLAILSTKNFEKTGSEEAQLQGVHKERGKFPIEISWGMISGEGENLFTVMARDVSQNHEIKKRLESYAKDLEQANTKLEKVNLELERSNTELDDFAYIASHDLKEPLRGMSNVSNHLLKHHEDKLDDRGKSKLKTLERLTHKMEDVINSLLHYSRVGQTGLNLTQVDTQELVLEVKDSLQISLEEKDIDLRIPRKLPLASCDRVRIREVFLNLITNAMKYNNKPKKWIEIGYLDEKEKKEDLLGVNQEIKTTTFYVKDNGIGIKEKHLESMFQMFKRLNHREKFGEGTGVGLTIVKKIVEYHNGKIWVDSIYGEGTTFYFII